MPQHRERIMNALPTRGELFATNQYHQSQNAVTSTCRFTMIMKIEDNYANSSITMFSNIAIATIMKSILRILLAIRGGCTLFPRLKNQMTTTKAVKVTASPSIREIYTNE